MADFKIAKLTEQYGLIEIMNPLRDDGALARWVVEHIKIPEGIFEISNGVGAASKRITPLAAFSKEFGAAARAFLDAKPKG